MKQIERIEIVKGPASALYGSDAIGGVINIITRTPSSLLEGDAKFSYGTNNMAEIGAYAGWRNDSWKTQLTAGWYRRDAYDLDSSDLQTNGSAFSNYNITQKTNYKFDKEKEITASTSYQYRLRNGIDSNTTGAIFDRRNLTEFFSTKLSSKTRFPNSGLIRLSGQYNIFRDQFVLDQRNSSALDKDEETRCRTCTRSRMARDVINDKHPG